MKVYKFGGTSLGSAQRMKNIGDIIPQHDMVLVVLSAMSGTTDRLSVIGQKIEQGNRSEALGEVKKLRQHYDETLLSLFEPMDLPSQTHVKERFTEIESIITQGTNELSENRLIAFGEQLSTFLFYRMLLSKQLSVALLDATALIHLNEQGEPQVEDIRKRLIEKMHNHPEACIFITQGFICSDHLARISNLGRGGSDYSASLFGAALQADEIQIWTDIDGVQNNDPRYVQQTRPIRQLHFEEAAELAYFGAKILHPLCILPAQKADIPVLLKNTLQPADPGTKVSSVGKGKGFKAVAARDNITAIRIKSSRMLMAYGFTRKVFEVFEEFKTSIDMITTSEVAVSITIDDKRYLGEIIEKLKNYGSVEVEENNTIVAVVGLVDAGDPGHAMRLFAALGHIPIRMISYGASPHNISILIKTTDKLNTLKALHAGLFQS